MTKPDFSELIDWRLRPAIQDACARMYEAGAVIVEGRPRPDKGISMHEIRGWKVSPYAH